MSSRFKIGPARWFPFAWSQQAWVAARKQSNFKQFQLWLEKVVALKREEAQAIGYRGVPYDALLDQYEPGATTVEVTRVFGVPHER